jgi:hypothetical protein
MWHVAQQILTAQHLCPSPWGWAFKKRDIQEQALYTGDTRRPEQGSDSSFSPQALNALQYPDLQHQTSSAPNDNCHFTAQIRLTSHTRNNKDLDPEQICRSPIRFSGSPGRGR